MRRLVFYLHGFDPRGPAYYHALYRDEAAKQAQVTGRSLSVGPRRALGPFASAWTVAAEAGGGPAETLFEIQRWDDIVRAHWARNAISIAIEALRYAWQFLRAGVYRRIFRLQPQRVLTALTPMATVLGLLLLPLAGAALAGLLARFALAWPWWLGLVVLPPLAFVSLKAIRALDKRTHLPWLARYLAFNADEGRGKNPDYDSRKDVFAARLVEHARAALHDEILVIGHSMGAALAVSVLARALSLDPDLLRRGPRLVLVTLGQSIPALGGFPEARGFREELSNCALAEGLEWVDFSSGADVTCFHRVDPVTGCDIARPAGVPVRPARLPARFHTLFSAATYDRLKRDRIRMHFQYLMATERAGRYDFFALTAGDLLPLERRRREARA